MRYATAVLLGIALLAVTGCQRPADDPAGPPPASSPAAGGPGLHELTLTSGGEERDYLLEVPASYQPGEPVPLIVVLHPGNGSARKVRSSSRMAELAEQQRVLVAYPQGVNGFWRPKLDGEHGSGWSSAATRSM